MTNSEKMLAMIDSFYGSTYSSKNYYLLKHNHLTLIYKLSYWWVDADKALPALGQRVFVLEDLTQTKEGRGKFISDMYYQECGFVANIGDADPYGYITRWISFDTIDEIKDLEL